MIRNFVSLALILVLPAPGFSLTIQKEVKVGLKTCDIVTWTDSDGKDRSVALVRADGDGKYSGGYVEQYTFYHGADKKIEITEAPSASDASRYERGTARRASSETVKIVGMTPSPSASPALTALRRE